MRNLNMPPTSFPVIGTFTLDSTRGPPPPQQQQPQQSLSTGIFDIKDDGIHQNPLTIGVFASNSVLTNGCGGNSSTFSSQSNSVGNNDGNQAIRETGIIEKLLVS